MMLLFLTIPMIGAVLNKPQLLVRKSFIRSADFAGFLQSRLSLREQDKDEYNHGSGLVYLHSILLRNLQLILN